MLYDPLDTKYVKQYRHLLAHRPSTRMDAVGTCRKLLCGECGRSFFFGGKRREAGEDDKGTNRGVRGPPSTMQPFALQVWCSALLGVALHLEVGEKEKCMVL
jgi:hypothetical protein